MAANLPDETRPSLETLVNAGVLRQRRDLARQFRSADPFPHHVIDNFLTAEFCQQLVAEFPGLQACRPHHEPNIPGGKAVYETVRDLGNAYCQLELPRISRLIGEITGIEGLLYDPDYSHASPRLSSEDPEPVTPKV